MSEGFPNGRTYKIRTCDQRIKSTVRACCTDELPSVRPAQRPRRTACFACFVADFPNLAMTRKRTHPIPPKTGWPPGLLQDDCRGLSKWFASRPDARLKVREVAKEILKERGHMIERETKRIEVTR